MASGNRASMREGPLSQLFRKTEEGQEAAAAAEPEPPPARTPTPQQRLRHAFSSDLPENMTSAPGPSRMLARLPLAIGENLLREIAIGLGGHPVRIVLQDRHTLDRRLRETDRLLDP